LYSTKIPYKFTMFALKQFATRLATPTVFKSTTMSASVSICRLHVRMFSTERWDGNIIKKSILIRSKEKTFTLVPIHFAFILAETKHKVIFSDLSGSQIECLNEDFINDRVNRVDYLHLEDGKLAIYNPTYISLVKLDMCARRGLIKEFTYTKPKNQRIAKMNPIEVTETIHGILKEVLYQTAETMTLRDMVYNKAMFVDKASSLVKSALDDYGITIDLTIGDLLVDHVDP
jgi:hypothetical protein